MNTPDQPEVLDCDLVPLPTPLRVAAPAFLASLREVEAQIATLKVIDPESANLASTLQGRLTQAGKILEQTRVTLTAPVLEQQRKINALAKAPADRIERAKSALKSALTAYDNECQRIAREAEIARQKELARLEELRIAEERAERERMAKLAVTAKSAPLAIMELDDEPVAPPQKTETEKRIEEVRHTPVVIAPAVRGVVWRTTLVPTITDVRKLPDLFVVRTPNMAAIRATFCVGYEEGEPLPVCDGVSFEAKKEAVTR